MPFTASGTQVTATTSDGTKISIGNYIEGTELPTATDILTEKSAWVNGTKVAESHAK